MLALTVDIFHEIHQQLVFRIHDLHAGQDKPRPVALVDLFDLGAQADNQLIDGGHVGIAGRLAGRKLHDDRFAVIRVGIARRHIQGQQPQSLEIEISLEDFLSLAVLGA